MNKLDEKNMMIDERAQDKLFQNSFSYQRYFIYF